MDLLCRHFPDSSSSVECFHWYVTALKNKNNSATDFSYNLAGVIAFIDHCFTVATFLQLIVLVLGSGSNVAVSVKFLCNIFYMCLHAMCFLCVVLYSIVLQLRFFWLGNFRNRPAALKIQSTWEIIKAYCLGFLRPRCNTSCSDESF